MSHDLDRIEHNINQEFFKINCTPIINLFKKRAEPIVFSEEKLEYKVLGDIRYPREVIVWSVNRVMLQKKKITV